MWRYAPLLPVDDPGAEGTPLRTAGWTPVYSPKDLAGKLGLKSLWVKDEGRNPTASFKDHASTVVISLGAPDFRGCDCYRIHWKCGCSACRDVPAIGQKAVIFAPKSAPPAKVAQLLIYGAKVILVDGNYDQAFDLSVLASKEFGWYCRNTGYNPFTLEGKKTGALEIWEQILLHSITPETPLSIFVSVGDGNIISGIHKGFKDLAALGWLEFPRIFGIQSEGSAAIFNAFEAGNEEIVPVQANTIADSISVDLPHDGVRAVRAATQTGGVYLTVKDDEIIRAISELGKVGIFAEPAGAAAYAGLLKALRDGKISPEDPILVLNTGNGLKNVRAAMQAAGEAVVIEPTMAALKKLLQVSGV